MSIYAVDFIFLMFLDYFFGGDISIRVIWTKNN